MVKEWSNAQRKLGISRSRGVILNEILTLDLSDQSPLFDENLTSEPDKNTLVSALEKYRSTIKYNFTKKKKQQKAIKRQQQGDFICQEV